MKKEKLSEDDRWSDREDDWIERLYGWHPWSMDDLLKVMPHRTEGQIKKRAWTLRQRAIIGWDERPYC